MQPKDAFTAISTTDMVASSLYKWVTGNRGLKRTVAIELKENIELIRLFVENGVEPQEIMPKINEAAFRHALAEGFNFNSLKRSKIGERSTGNVAQLKKYHGWDTQRVFENVYQKVATLKSTVTITNSKKPVRIDIRLNNLFKLMVMLATHVGS